METTSDSIRERLNAALPQALKEQDTVAVNAIGAALAAIEEADGTEPPVRDLPESDLLAIVLAEALDREVEAAGLRARGDVEGAGRLVAEAAYLREFTA